MSLYPFILSGQPCQNGPAFCLSAHVRALWGTAREKSSSCISSVGGATCPQSWRVPRSALSLPPSVVMISSLRFSEALDAPAPFFLQRESCHRWSGLATRAGFWARHSEFSLPGWRVTSSPSPGTGPQPLTSAGTLMPSLSRLFRSLSALLWGPGLRMRKALHAEPSSIVKTHTAAFKPQTPLTEQLPRTFNRAKTQIVLGSPGLSLLTNRRTPPG